MCADCDAYVRGLRDGALEITSTEMMTADMLATVFGVVLTVTVVASLLSRLSDVYRANCMARGLNDPGPVMLEGVLVVSAGLTIAAFVIWFFFLAGTSPVPIGIHV